MKLKLAEDLSLPLDAVTQTFLIVGKRGSGKSNTAARLVEQFYRAKLPFVVLDPVDTWWGLKAGRDGEKGLDVYVFGGRKADLPLNAGDGALIADVLCEHRASMVLSVKHLSGRERSAFMVKFAQTLFQKWGGGPLHVVLEEAHEFAPQMGGRGAGTNEDNEAAMLGAFKRLWKLGRSSGIGGSAITQRPASLSKDITTQAEILIAHRTIGPQDVAAVGQWVKYHGEKLDILADLPTLPTGEAYIWAPEFPEGKALGLIRTAILLRETYDSASTPKVGEQRVEPKELAPVDLEKLRVKMSATIEKAKAEDPRELRRQLAAVKTELAAKNKTLDQVDSQTKVIDGLIDTKSAELAARLETLDATIKKLKKLAGENIDRILGYLHKHATAEHDRWEVQRTKAEGWLQQLRDIQRNTQTTMTPRVDRQGPVSPQGRRVAPAAATGRPASLVSPSSNGHVTPAHQKILSGLAFLHGIGVAPADKTQLALLIGVSPTSGGYFNNLGTLRSAGYIDYPQAGTAALTDAGAAMASTDGVPSTTAELHDAIRAKLPLAKWKILDALIHEYPKALHKDDLAARIGVQPTSGGYFNNLGSLRSLGLIHYPQPGHAAATRVVFLDE